LINSKGFPQFVVTSTIKGKTVSVLVIGGAGFIGSHAAHALRRKGYEVIIYDNLSTGEARLADGFELIVGEMSDSVKLAGILKRVEAVMHFAAHAYVGESVHNPRKYFQNNLLDGIILLNAVLDSPVRKFIFSSTCAVYGTPEKLPITEETPRLPVNPYGASKVGMENALEAYDRAYGLRYVAFRYFNAAGADEEGKSGETQTHASRLIPSAFRALNGEIPAFEIFGEDYPTPDGSCVRDYIHVNDLAEAHVMGLEHLGRGQSMALNLGTGEGNSVKEVVRVVEKVTGKKVPVKMSARREGDPAELVANPRKAQQALNWKAKRSLEEVVSTAWRWNQKNRTPRSV
jgi:UDP-glucose-4-epimerase GalE